MPSAVTAQQPEVTDYNLRAPVATLGALRNPRELLLHLNCTQIFARPINTSAFIVTNQGEFNLRDVFGENDPARRRAAIDERWAEDGVFYDPSKSAIRGRDEIDRVAGTDFIISRGGRIAALYMFFDKLP